MAFTPGRATSSAIDYDSLAGLARDSNQQVALVLLTVNTDSQVTPFGVIAHHTNHKLTITNVTVEARSHV